MEKEVSKNDDRPTVLMRSFWSLQKSIMKQVKQTAVDNDLSIPQFAILHLMERDGVIPQKKLQARTHYPKSTLSHAIEGLAQAGFVTRAPMTGNRREMELALSDSGKSLLKNFKDQDNSVHTRFTDAVNSFTDEEFAELIAMHQQIATFFEGMKA